MKKLLALIVMIVMAAGAVTASAQSAAFGINTFCQPLSKSSGYSAQSLGISTSVFKKIQNMKSDNAIHSALLKAGFTCTSKKNLSEYDESIDERVTYMKATYTKAVSGGKIIVKKDWGDVTISFPNTNEKNKFLQTIKAEQSKGYIYTSTNYYWVGVRIETGGNTIRLVALGG